MLLSHEAVDEDHEPRRRGREGAGERVALGRDGEAVDAHRDRLLQRAALALEAVADQPVEDREAEAAGQRGRERALRPRAAAHERLGAAAERGRGAAERAHDPAGHGVVDEADRLARRHVAEGAGGDVALRRPDAAREAVELVETEADESCGLVVAARQLCHGSMYLRFG